MPVMVSVTPSVRLGRIWARLREPGERVARPCDQGHSPRRQRTTRYLGEDQQDPVERGVQSERRPHGPAPEEDPAEREGDRDPRTEADGGEPEGIAGVRAADRQDMGNG